LREVNMVGVKLIEHMAVNPQGKGIIYRCGLNMPRGDGPGEQARFGGKVYHFLRTAGGSNSQQNGNAEKGFHRDMVRERGFNSKIPRELYYFYEDSKIDPRFMIKNAHHRQILKEIKANSGQATQHTFLDSYLGNTHPRYPINAPTLRLIAKEWAKANRDLPAEAFAAVLTSLVQGVSGTEKIIAGMLLDYSTPSQRKFDAALFDSWLDHLEGWAEVDALCTGAYTVTEIPGDFGTWKKLLTQFSKSDNIQKRRASLVMLCSPVSKNSDERLAKTAVSLMDRLKDEKAILITKAISWLLRSMIKHHRDLVDSYVDINEDSLPKIAVRETRVKLDTGTKTRRTK
jgi:3-methyladenine DNA glycosylase AlkD